MKPEPDELERLIATRRDLEHALEVLDEAERIGLQRLRLRLLTEFEAHNQAIGKALGLNVLTPGLSARRALREVLEEAGPEGLQIAEIQRRVNLRTNKGTLATIEGYLQDAQYEQLPAAKAGGSHAPAPTTKTRGSAVGGGGPKWGPRQRFAPRRRATRCDGRIRPKPRTTRHVATPCDAQNTIAPV